MEIVKMDVDGESVQTTNYTVETSEPQEVQRQSWAGIWVDVTQQPIHIVLNDAYHGIGGFSGNVSADGKKGGYTYLTPTGAEMLFIWRIKQTWYHNFFARFINAQVFPVFGNGSLNVNSPDKDFKKWIADCTGTGVPYSAMQSYSMCEIRVHDVAYYTMTKTRKGKTSLGVYRAIDVVYAKNDEDGQLNDIAFFRGTTEKEGKEVSLATRFFMDGNYCAIQNFEADSVTSDWKEFKAVEQPRSTDVDRMCVYAHIPTARPSGEWVPSNPRSKSVFDCCMNIYNDESSSEWLYKLLTQPLPYAYDVENGINAGAGALVILSTSAGGGVTPPPSYMAVPSGALNEATAYLEMKIDHLREIAKENGVDTKTGAQAQSGDSKRYDFQATEAKLQETVSYCRTMNEWVFEMYNILNNINSEVIEHSIDYPESFYPEEEPTFAEYEALETRASELGAYTLANVVLGKWAKRLLGKSATAEEAELITAELETLQREKSIVE